MGWWRQICVAGLVYLVGTNSACQPVRQALETGAPVWNMAPGLDVPYVPTPPSVVRRMLQIAQVGPHDMVYDLGAGDGRIAIAAARQFGARAVGVELDPERIKEAKANAEQAGVSDRVRFLQQDLFTADISEATVVTLFLTPALNLRLRPKLWSELKPGTRVVAHLYDMGDWKPTKMERVDGRPVYDWIIPDNASVQVSMRTWKLE
jgi:protein-L-isoaspartate O-methyltransferase